MSEQNLSQWFDLAEQKPWEVGVYEVFSGTIKGFSYWDGADFQEIHLTPERAAAGYAAGLRATQKWWPISKMWRGISTNPEVKNKPRNQRKQFVIVMEAAGENLERQHPVGVFEDEKNADAFLEIHQKRCPKFYYYKSWTPRFRTPE